MIRLCLLICLCCTPLWAQTAPEPEKNPLTLEQLRAAAVLLGLEFKDSELTLMRDDLWNMLKAYQSYRTVSLANSVAPALRFQPLADGASFKQAETPPSFAIPEAVIRPEREEDLAFMSVSELGVLIRTGKLSCLDLTQLYLSRLKTYGPRLACVILLLEDRALAQARSLDAEIAAGHYRGPLHGIPYGAKDLLALKGFPTTWGSAPYQEQVLDETATVIERLDAAGAILVAKLSLGELAWGDVWFGGQTKNPWNLAEGSSGSSAGSASATSAGLVAFALGSETYGSIVSPSTRCGVTGLRPSFGRVSRHGAMALCWSLDKLGPIARSVDDCALIFDAIRGKDGKDQTVVDASFPFEANGSVKGLRVGYIPAEFEGDEPGQALDRSGLEHLRSLGVTLVPIAKTQYDIDTLTLILSAEAAAAFDELTRSNRDDLMKRQEVDAWPNANRAARYISAVEYIQANRIRSLVQEEMAKTMTSVDAVVAPSLRGQMLWLTNLTGHPCVVLPNGLIEANKPTSLTLIGQLYDEATLLRLARAYQAVKHDNLKRPLGYLSAE